MQTVKRKLGIKSVYKADDWYWTLNPDAVDADADDRRDQHEDDADDDETPVMFLDEMREGLPILRTQFTPVTAITSISPVISAASVAPATLPKPAQITIQSPFGELTLIDWRAYA